MDELIKKLRKKQSFEQLCDDKGVNPGLLTTLLMYRMRGYNNLEIAQKLGLHRFSVDRYYTMFNNLSDRELATVFEFYLSYGGDKPIVDIEPGQTEFIHGLKKSILDGDDWSMLDKEG